MADISLKEYIKRAKELEVAVYTQRALMNEHEAVLLKKRPIHPKKKTVEMPTAFSATYPQRDSQMEIVLRL